MSTLTSFSLLLIFFLQSGYTPSFPEGTFTGKEKKKIEKNQDNLEERTEVYRDACVRILKQLRKDIAQNDYPVIPDRLKTWTTLLSESLKDIEANMNPDKKKPKDLMKYEIEIRKAINDLKDYQLRAPAGQQDVFERCISEADTIHGKIVDILFQ